MDDAGNDERQRPLSLVLFSGTDDKLTAAAVLAVGAAVMGRRVKVFIQYYALDAFRAGRVCADHGLSPEATAAQALSVRAHKGQHWSELGLTSVTPSVPGSTACSAQSGWPRPATTSSCSRPPRRIWWSCRSGSPRPSTSFSPRTARAASGSWWCVEPGN